MPIEHDAPQNVHTVSLLCMCSVIDISSEREEKQPRVFPAVRCIRCSARLCSAFAAVHDSDAHSTGNYAKYTLIKQQA